MSSWRRALRTCPLTLADSSRLLEIGSGPVAQIGAAVVRRVIDGRYPRDGVRRPQGEEFFGNRDKDVKSCFGGGSRHGAPFKNGSAVSPVKPRTARSSWCDPTKFSAFSRAARTARPACSSSLLTSLALRSCQRDRRGSHGGATRVWCGPGAWAPGTLRIQPQAAPHMQRVWSPAETPSSPTTTAAGAGCRLVGILDPLKVQTGASTLLSVLLRALSATGTVSRPFVPFCRGARDFAGGQLHAADTGMRPSPPDSGSWLAAGTPPPSCSSQSPPSRPTPPGSPCARRGSRPTTSTGGCCPASPAGNTTDNYWRGRDDRHRPGDGEKLRLCVLRGARCVSSRATATQEPRTVWTVPGL